VDVDIKIYQGASLSADQHALVSPRPSLSFWQPSLQESNGFDVFEAQCDSHNYRTALYYKDNKFEATTAQALDKNCKTRIDYLKHNR